MESSNNDIHVFTQSSTTPAGYVFYPVSKDKKCFSFQVRATVFPHVILSATPSVVEGQKLEVILEYNGQSVIRTKDNKHVVTAPIKNIVNDQELRGFWIRWLDDYLLEVGRDTDNYPFLSYRLPEKLSVNFIGILSYTTCAEWILHKDPKCNSETKCGTTKKLDSIKNNILQISQQHILSQIKKQHGIFQARKFRTRDILLEYQQLVRKHFSKAQENQNKIYESEDNNEIYCPLKSIIFDEITEVYFQFLEELEMELAMFKPVSVEINVPKECERNCGSCNCSK